MDIFWINGYYLDKEQIEAITSVDKYILLLAGAGSGKTTTIVGKVRYLIEDKKIKDEDILCVSFTNNAVLHLKKIFDDYKYNVQIFTVHKLALNIISDYTYFSVMESGYLSYIINEYFSAIILSDVLMIKCVLAYFFKFCTGDVVEFYKSFFVSNKDKFKKLYNDIERVINLYKTFMYDSNYWFYIYNNVGFRDKILIILIYKIYLIYEEELKSCSMIDFSSMIKNAIEVIKKYGLKKKYKYVIIDEAQDMSKLRFEFIDSIVKKSNASLFMVGDDYQSIYRFSGSDLDLFLNFSKIYGGIVKRISMTYRNSNELIRVCSHFIMRNPRQLKKNLCCLKSNLKPFKFVFYSNIRVAFRKIIDSLSGKIMVLSRNKFDIKDILDKDMILSNDKIIYKENKDISYYTVHACKGMEADYVILINNRNDCYGFPSKVKNSKIFKYFNQDDKFWYEEERRLFYVALTRTKNDVFLLIPCFNFSIFIWEFIIYYRKYIEFSLIR